LPVQKGGIVSPPFDGALAEFDNLTVAAKRPPKVTERLQREAAELARTAKQLHTLVKGGVWLSSAESLAEVERRVRAAWAAIRVRWSPQEVEAQLHNAIETYARLMVRTDWAKLTREQAVAHATEMVGLILNDPRSVEAIGAARRVDPALVERAVLAHVAPAGRGRPRKGTTVISKADAMAALLHSLGLVDDDVEVPSEAVRRRMARRARK
jgi:hypothetical protein